MKKLLLIFLVLVLLIPITLANLKIEPQSISSTVYANYEKIINVKLTNEYNFSIFNIVFTEPNNDFTFPEISELTSGESKDIEIKIKTNEAYSTITQHSTVRFNYYTSINSNPKIHNVTIIFPSLTPDSITIEKGDYVSWINKESQSHTVYAQDNSFTKTIKNNSISDLTKFNTIQSITYCDILFGGCIYHIEVTNKSKELTYDESKNKQMTFIINSIYNETTIEMTLLDDNFSIEYNEVSDGMLRIENNGGFEIKNVILTSDYPDWISFDENEFNINSGQTKIIIFTIDPKISEIDQTNSSYEIDIRAKGINSGQVKDTLFVFIPYEEELENYGNMSKEELVKALKDLETVLKNLNLEPNPDCPDNKPYWSTTEKKCISEAEMTNQVIQYNYTQEEVSSIFLKIGGINDELSTLGDYQNPILEDIQNKFTNLFQYMEEIKKSTNESYTLAKENEETIQSGKRWRVVWIVAIILALLGGVAYYLIYYRKKQKEL